MNLIGGAGGRTAGGGASQHGVGDVYMVNSFV